MLAVKTSTLPDAGREISYLAQFEGSGGALPYTWSVPSGGLPPGISLDSSSGELRGIPSQTGTFTFSVQVEDSVAEKATASFQLNVGLPWFAFDHFELDPVGRQLFRDGASHPLSGATV